jgi:DNA processing protein
MPQCPPTTAAHEDDRLARLALNQAVEPADVSIGRLLECHSPVDVLAAIHGDRLADLEPDPARRIRLTERAAGFRLRLEPGRIDEAVAAADAVGARFLVPGDLHWPAALDDLAEQRPIGIWATGRWPTRSADAISVVGARACTGYGTYVAGALGADLASAGVTVISGAAAPLYPVSVVAVARYRWRGRLREGGSILAGLSLRPSPLLG